MVAGNEVLTTAKHIHQLLDLMTAGPPAEITETEDEVILFDLFIPVFDETLQHILFVGKWAIAKFDDIAMAEV